MTALAAARTAGALPYNVTPEHTARARAILGPDRWLCVEQKVLLVTDATKAREVARQAMAFYLPLPNYRQNWQRLGFREEDLANGGSHRFWTLWSPGVTSRPFDNASKPMLMRGPAMSASSPCIQTGSPSQTSRPWPLLPPSGTGACVPAACRIGDLRIHQPAHQHCGERRR